MNNAELLNKRWKKTDDLLKAFQKVTAGLTGNLKNEILDMFDSVDVALSDLNKTISKRENARLDRVINQWEEMGLDNDYLTYKIKTRKKKTNYASFIELLLLGIYAVYMHRIYERSKSLFTAIANDAVKQAKAEMGREPKKPFLVTWDTIENLLVVNTLQKPLDEYLQLLTQTDADEAYKFYLQSKQVGATAGFSEAALAVLLQKQQNRLISVKDGKESGMLSDVGRQLWNETYTEPYKKENVQVRFIAEMDRATTEMCKGMDNMLFYTNDWNRYYRYSALDKKDVLYTTFGLKVGENLPPINNHFHWCRSTITYDLKLNALNRLNQFLRERRPGIGSYEKAQNFVAIDGNYYQVDGKHVKETADGKETKIGKWWLENIGGEVKVNPKVEFPLGVKSADFTIDGELVELKSITGSGKNTMYDAVKNSGMQANVYIFDIEDSSKLTDLQIYEQSERLIKSPHTKWVEKIFVKRGDEIVFALEKK